MKLQASPAGLLRSLSLPEGSRQRQCQYCLRESCGETWHATDDSIRLVHDDSPTVEFTLPILGEPILSVVHVRCVSPAGRRVSGDKLGLRMPYLWRSPMAQSLPGSGDVRREAAPGTRHGRSNTRISVPSTFAATVIASSPCTAAPSPVPSSRPFIATAPRTTWSHPLRPAARACVTSSPTFSSAAKSATFWWMMTEPS